MPKCREKPVPIRKSSESVLRNSQSPSFADFKLDEEGESSKISRKRDGLTIRDKHQRTKSISPIKRSEPEPKRIKAEEKEEEEEVKLIETGFTSDYFWEIRENSKRIQKITGADFSIFEIYQTMRSSASEIPCPRPILPDDSPRSSSELHCSIEDRRKTILGMFSRRFALKVCTETLHLAVALLDICLQKMLIDSEALMDLAAVTLVIASKVEEINCLSIQNIISLKMVGNGRDVEMISRLERVVLSVLQFRVTIPTPFTFATYLLVHLGALPPKISMTSYLLELSVLYVFNREHPSDSIAHAATCLAFAIDCDGQDTPAKTLLDMELRLNSFCKIGVASRRTRDIMCTLADLYIVAPIENHAVYQEYCTSRRYSVALRPFTSSLQKALRIDGSP